MSPRSRLAQRHLVGQQALAQRVAGALALLLREPNPSDEFAAAYAHASARVHVAGRSGAASLTAGYVRLAQALRGARPLAPIELPRFEPEPGGWSELGPIVSLRANLAEGVPWTSAVELARGVASQRSARALQEASRLGGDVAARAYPTRPRWAKAPDGEACDWCLEIAGQEYRSAESVPSHDGDRCSVEIV